MLNMLALVSKEGVRHATALDYLPLWYGETLLPQPDYDWIWVVQRDSRIQGVLVGAPCHGVAMVLRLINFTDDPTVVRQLLREAGREARARGYRTYFIIGNPKRPEEASLLQAAERFGAGIERDPHMVAAGSIPEKL
jgi:hypothetical protein